VKADGIMRVNSLLDYGCHTGGLLQSAVSELHPSHAWGIEPILHSRHRAIERLRGLDTEIRVVADDWDVIPDASIDLVLCHEVLYLVEDLLGFFHQVARKLSARCSAYVVLGCHTENPLWPSWKRELENIGHVTHDYSPFDLMRAGAEAGLAPALRPLRESGWVYHDPRETSFSFPSAQMLLDHQFRHKLLFRFSKP
jgi:hypothetical protein